MTIPCPDCGAENESENRFCTQCGSKMPDGAPRTKEVGGGDGHRGRATGRLDVPPDWEEVEVTHLRPDEHRRHVVKDRFTIGRDRGDLVVPNDPYLSSQHAVIQKQKGRYLLQDLGSRNGTFIRISREEDLLPGDEMMMGSQILRYRIEQGRGEGGDAPTVDGSDWRGAVLMRVVERRRVDEVYPLAGDRTVIGRDQGDVRFPDDALLSGVHASVVRRTDSEGGALHAVRDEGSRNGAFLRIRDLWVLKEGDVFTAGRQVFRFEGEASGETDGDNGGGY